MSRWAGSCRAELVSLLLSRLVLQRIGAALPNDACRTDCPRVVPSDAAALPAFVTPRTGREMGSEGVRDVEGCVAFGLA